MQLALWFSLLFSLLSTSIAMSVDGWYPSQWGQDCTQACQYRGLVCTEQGLEDHNSDVDSSEKLLKLIGALPIGNYSNFAPCKLVKNKAAPTFRLLGDVTCGYAPSDRRSDSYSCGNPGPKLFFEERMSRMCYCHKNPDTPVGRSCVIRRYIRPFHLENEGRFIDVESGQGQGRDCVSSSEASLLDDDFKCRLLPPYMCRHSPECALSRSKDDKILNEPDICVSKWTAELWNCEPEYEGKCPDGCVAQSRQDARRDLIIDSPATCIPKSIPKVSGCIKGVQELKNMEFYGATSETEASAVCSGFTSGTEPSAVCSSSLIMIFVSMLSAVFSLRKW